MSVSKQQFQLPLQVATCDSPERPMSEREPRELSARRTRNDPPVRIQRQPNAGSESDMTAPSFVALTDIENLRAAGIAYPSTVHGWRWLFRHRHERGLGDAFRRIGRRIVVDPERYRELVRASSGA